MPKEIKSKREVLAAIATLPALADLLHQHDGHYEFELDLEVCVYGRNYQGKQVGPYIRLLDCEPNETIIRQGDWGGNTFYISVDREMDVVIKSPTGGDLRVAAIPAGRQFGEMSVLAGVPRAATVKVSGDSRARILEIQRPALRLLRKIPRFRDSLDAVYLNHGRMAAFQQMCIRREVGEAMLVPEARELSHFRVYSKNHVLFRAGAPVTELYVIKEGWLRRAVPAGQSDYLGRGYCFGLEAAREDARWPYTVTLLSRGEVLIIPLAPLVEQPKLRAELLGELDSFAPPPLAKASPAIQSAQARLITTGLTDAGNLLVMDMDLCVRCGRCSLACHTIHGQSRLLRRGIAIQRANQALLSPMACMHCQDPECLTGCPTGAIGRFADGQVDINPKTCIGCGDCAINCPYNAISMVQRATKASPAPSTRARLQELIQISPAPLPPAVEPNGELLAVKCNLCHGTSLNPPQSSKPVYGCEENCPTGALARVNPEEYFDEIAAIEGPAFTRRSSAAPNLHRSDPPMRRIHTAGIACLLLVTAATLAGLHWFGFNGLLLGVTNMRWLTGLTGLLAIAATLAYPWRRRRFVKRAGPLRYWMLGHVYFGALGAVEILLHGGARSGGALTTALAISFDLVLLTGLWGILCYRLVPRRLHRLEPGTPLLADDLESRRQELVADLAVTSEPARRFVEAAADRFSSLAFLLRQFDPSASLHQTTAAAHAEFAAELENLPPEDRLCSTRALDALVALPRVHALRFLHGLLKSWLIPHVAATSLMLALLAVHIFQAIYGAR